MGDPDMRNIKKRAEGVWEVRVFVGRDPITNNPRQVSKTVHGGIREARAERTRLEAEASAGKLKGSAASIDFLLDEYFAHLERKDLSPQTLHAYRRYARLHLRPALGKLKVRKLTAWDLDKLYASMANAGKSASTIRQAHAIISGALGQATKWGWCPANVAKMASPPTVRSAPIVPPGRDQVRALVTTAEERNPTLGALIMLAGLTGARRGELCALRWTDVDLAAGTVRIARSMLDLPGRVEEKSTKSHQVRTLALGVVGVELLERHRAAVDERARLAEVTVLPDGFVFSEELDGSVPVRPDRVTGFFTKLRNDLELGHVHFHSLRHFMATTLAARGDVSARTLAGRLGHADASVSLKVYSAFFPPADLEAADHLGRALRP